MTRKDAIAYAVKAIPEILPLEEQDVKNLCDQILNTSNNDFELIANEFLSMLGHEDLAFAFVVEFNRLLSEGDKKNDELIKEANRNEDSRKKKPMKPDVDKKQFSEDSKPNANVDSQPQLVRVSKPIGKTVSESFKPDKKKSSKKDSTGTKKTKKAHSLKEIDEVVKKLELERDDEDSSSKYACNCQANRHPLFDAAPNCLSCGKIICAREGMNLNNCSFCGSDLIPVEERIKIIELLKQEREVLINGDKNKPQGSSKDETKSKKKTYKVSSNMGTNLFDEQDKLFEFIEKSTEKNRKETQEKEEQQKSQEMKQVVDSDLVQAQDRLNKLLHFQDTSAERTRIIDNASDFSISEETGLWGNARERALMLKKQQRNLRKWEKLEKERNGRREKVVVNMNIGKDGKVTLLETPITENSVPANSDDELENISDEEDINDLKHIKHLKSEIDLEKKIQTKVLQSSSWDLDQYNNRFERPVYMSSSSNGEDDRHSIRNNEKGWKSKVQINDNDNDDSLEQNILYVL
ncbi:hypothetical protein Kpol_463p15 [Vanderwaltozyma polyspora DSM 70294]|uniref:TRIP4/RQT4 C2HC5-type zinc finger domain-containing protein n=1 Tax=Vanderwaltozyma polyspora (strain ATCC 22028 / DSM 70294 / BCRC 21397 / CBS 2163 / NBRC 10782 / NRRL Y-8283 / UCD 57-17) TaxID=436907 RepID=A7TQK1_VANPO|nr:uncharacterized protein Kpol_463p15 [Vanderwaltozyma polyspora DSM 70294]EDO15465.1 hypothetical protein Kpol_463p15 [Vanderwaltozyma polyspora DSM 70294]